MFLTKLEILDLQEKGEIYFFYKPKAGVDNPETKEDVQHLCVVLRPEEAEKKIEEKQSSDSGISNNWFKNKYVSNARELQASISRTSRPIDFS